MPIFLLSHFTDTGTADGFLSVRDTKTGKVRRQRPKEVAVERDFYRIELEGVDPFLAEKELGRLETVAAPIIKDVQTSRTIPSEDGLVVLLEFAAYLAVRGPWLRNGMLAMAQQAAKDRLLRISSSQAAYEAELERSRMAGQELPDVGIEMVRRLAENVIAEGDQTGLVQQIEVQAEMVFSDMIQRPWSLFVAGSRGPWFVLSDSPVSRLLPIPKRGIYLRAERAFSLALGPRIALVSDLSSAKRVDSNTVYAVNRATMAFASLVFGAERPMADIVDC